MASKTLRATIVREDQREHVEAIAEAKKPETRVRRIEHAVQMVRATR